LDLNQQIQLKSIEGTKVVVEEKRFTMIPYEGQVIEWMGDRIVLDIKTIKLRKDVIPAFIDHDPSRLAGEIDMISTEDNRVSLAGSFLLTKHAEELQAKKKLEYECSMSFYPSKGKVQEIDSGEVLEANGRKYDGPLYFIEDGEVHESSFTYYGAVNGACAEFSKESNQEVSMSGQGKGGEQTPQQPSAQEVLSKMVELSGDKAFATDCFLKGVGIEEFKDRLHVSLSEKNKDLSETIVELKKENDALKAEIVELKNGNDDGIHAGKGDLKTMDYIELSKKYAKDHGVSLSKAMSVVSAENPDLYAKFTGRS